jgi:hypothetical protein
MNAWIKWIGVGVLALCCGAVNAQEPRDVAAPNASPASPADPQKLVEMLAGLMKERLVQALPSQLVIEKENNWGHQAQVPSIQGLTPIYVRRNHGDWQKSRVIARDVPQRLKVSVGWLCATADNCMSFNVHVALPADLELRQQIWQNGVQVYTSHLRSRFQLSAHLAVEADLQPAAAGASGSGKVVRLLLVRGAYSCDHFVAENVNGLGGDFARWLDNGAGHSFKPWQPAVLNDFQKQVANAIGTAGAVPEVQACVGKLLLHSSTVRSNYVQAQSTTPVSAIGPACPPSVPLCLNTSVEFSVSNLDRVSVPHIEHLLHPALVDFTVHVAHAALEAASRIRIEPDHKK